MNFLAHLALARPTAPSRIGNLLGDFAKGTLESLRPIYPSAVLEGIQQHRAVDSYTDAHPTFLAAKKLLPPAQRRFAGIVIDVYYDHFLARHWLDYYAQPLADFIADVAGDFAANPQWLPLDLADLWGRIQHERWLERYAEVDWLRITFVRFVHRKPKLHALAHAEIPLVNHYEEFEHLFRQFYPELREFSANYLTLNSPRSTTSPPPGNRCQRD